MNDANAHKPGYKHTPLGWVPKEWEVKEIGEIGKLSSGTTPSRQRHEDFFLNGSIPWVKTTDLNNDNIWVTEESVTELALAQTSLKIYPIDTLLIAMYGGFNQIGRTGLLKIPAAVNQALTALQLNSNIEPKYVLEYLKFRVGYWKNFAGSSRKDPNITSKDVADFPVLLPPLPEQNQIATILSTWDTAIAKTQEIIRQLQVRNRGLMQELFRPKEGWKEIELGQLGYTFNGLSGKSKEDFGTGKPFITYLNIFNNLKIDITDVGYVKIDETESQNKVQFGDIFFTISSETPDEVGMASVLLDNPEEMYLNSFCFGFRLNDFHLLKPEFAAYYLRCQSFRKKLNVLAQGATRFNLSKSQVLKLMVELPNEEDQLNISKILDNCTLEVKLQQNHLTTLQTQKKGLMQKLLTGAIRVNLNHETS